MSELKYEDALKLRDEWIRTGQAAVLYRQALIKMAQGSDNPEGFAAFYELAHGNKLPDHGWMWIEDIYQAKEYEESMLIFAWRGSWKTTTISVTFTAFRIGKDPHRANLIIQANDSSSVKTAKSIADLIEFNEAFKWVFPAVVPDYDKGWGAEGYEVKRTDIEYAEWRKLNSSRNDPTLLGLGVASKSLIGKHPDGVLLMDDIHDEENTISETTIQRVKNKITGTILPFIVEDEEGHPITWTIAIGTPWTNDDAYYMLAESGEWRFLRVPLIEPVEDDEEEGDDLLDIEESEFSDLVGVWLVAWPEKYTQEVIERWRRRVGKRDFSRMYRLDIDSSLETGINYQTFPAEKIEYDWEFASGVDFASVRERYSGNKQLKNRSYFALAYGAKIPTGGGVIVGGEFGHKTQAESEDLIESIQGSFNRFRHTVIEDTGKGETFTDLMMTKPHLRIMPMGTNRVQKHLRQERTFKYIELGIWRISDADTPFLNTLRIALDNFPDGNDDVRDASVALIRAFPELLQIDMGYTDVPKEYRVGYRESPWAKLAKIKR